VHNITIALSKRINRNYMGRLFLILLILPLIAKGQIVCTIYGTGVAGYNGNNGPANAAQLDHPARVKFDQYGNMYIAEEYSNVVRKISTTNTITTVVGTGYGSGTGGTSGDYSGDNGPATAARLWDPSDIAFDAVGNLYISEYGNNNTIRKVTPSGIITTIAGTGAVGYNGDNIAATSAKLYDPFGLVFDKSGNLYFTDNGNHRVRKINTSGIISTIAGTGIAGYNGDGIPATGAQVEYPGYLAFNPAGELCIADYPNHRVRKIDAAGIITTIAGTGVAGNNGDNGPATAAALNSPWALLFDLAGNMYISDLYIGVIRKVTAAGIISTIAGTGVTGYSGDNGPATSAQFGHQFVCSAVDASGNLYIADHDNNRIRRITYNSIGVKEWSQTKQQIIIYPNPAQKEITIQADQKIESIEVVNIIGAFMRAATAKSLSQTQQHLNISSLPNGIYFVKVNGMYAGRFVKE
jgi:hypothetical protein